MTPILTDHAFDLITHSPQQTVRVGKRLGRLLGSGDVACLQGALGSGKTCLTQGIAAGLGIEATVSSPTFVFINEYKPTKGGLYLYHVDLYRVEDPLEAFGLGLEDYMYGDGVTVIEWAERARELMPEEHLWITLTYVDYTKRSLLFEAVGDRYRRLLAALKDELFASRSASSNEE